MTSLTHVSRVVKPTTPPTTLPTLFDRISTHADAIRAHDWSPEGEWIAGKLDELARQVRSLQATTPDEFEARSELQERWRDERIARSPLDLVPPELRHIIEPYRNNADALAQLAHAFALPDPDAPREPLF